MDLQLFSIDAAPKTLPIWELILDDLGRPPIARIAETLDVAPSTVYRWQQSECVPRMACLALFWLTRWGRSEIDCRATNDAMTAVALARSLSEERNGLRSAVTTLREERDRLAGMVHRFTALAHENAGRGSVGTAVHSRTGMALGGSWGGAPAWGVAQELLEHQELSFPRLDEYAPAGAHRGSPSETPQGARSEIYRDGQRTAAPQLSDPREDAQWLPSVASQRYHNDAIMASPAATAGRLVGTETSPALRASGRPPQAPCDPPSSRAPAGAVATASRAAFQGDASTDSCTQASSPASTTVTRLPPSGGIPEGGPLCSLGATAPAPALTPPARSVFASMTASLSRQPT